MSNWYNTINISYLIESYPQILSCNQNETNGTFKQLLAKCLYFKLIIIKACVFVSFFYFNLEIISKKMLVSHNGDVRVKFIVHSHL